VNRNNQSIGLVLILIAVVLLLGKLGVFSFLAKLLWPILLLGIGLGLHFLYFNRRVTGNVLIFAGVIVTYSLLFLFCNLFGWGSLSYLWPVIPFGFAVGLYEYQLFDRYAPSGTLTMAMVIGGLSAALFVLTLLFKLGIFLIVLILLVIGISMLVFRRRTW